MSADSKDIRKTAAEAAEAFRPHSSECGGNEEEVAATVASPENLFLMDDEEFGMHGLVANMAEGLMMPPPRYTDDVEMDADVSLWSYSI